MAETNQEVAALYNELEFAIKYINNCVSNINKKGRNNWTSRFLQERLTTLNENHQRAIILNAKYSTVFATRAKETIHYFKEKLFENAEDAYQDAVDFINEEIGKLLPEDVSLAASSPRFIQRSINASHFVSPMQFHLIFRNLIC